MRTVFSGRESYADFIKLEPQRAIETKLLGLSLQRNNCAQSDGKLQRLTFACVSTLTDFQILWFWAGGYAGCFPKVISSLFLFLYPFAHILVLVLWLLIKETCYLFSFADQNWTPQARATFSPSCSFLRPRYLVHTSLGMKEGSLHFYGLQNHTMIPSFLATWSDSGGTGLFLLLKPGLGYLIRAGWLLCVAWNYYKWK